ncbi:MAG TPA: DMT family transporter [Terriglobales bacterium]|nr:DMT family transporter [Terriglobales bacterium]
MTFVIEQKPDAPRKIDSVSRSLKAHLLLVLMTLIWGSTFVLIKAALRDSSPLVLNAVRMSLAAVLLALWYRRQLAGMTRGSLFMGLAVGLFLYLGYAFQTSGLRLTTPSKSAFLTGISTVIVPVIMLTIWRTRVHTWRVVGIALALAGLFLMTVPAGGEGLASFREVNFGDVLSFFCAIAFAFHIVFIGRATQRHPFEQIAVLQVSVAAVLMVFSAPFLESPQFHPSPTVLACVLITGILGTALAFTVQAWAQQFTPATHAALIFTLEPAFAWLTSFIYMKERLGLRAGSGALLILAGVLVSELLGQVAGPDLPQPANAAPTPQPANPAPDGEPAPNGGQQPASPDNAQARSRV